MGEAELFFAIGAEALHLKLGQARLTSHEVWAGAFAHTKGGVELILGVLPLLQGMPLGPSVTKFLERVPEPALRRGLEALVRFERETRGKRQAPSLAPPSALSHVNENLLAAHRLMQMSADRAGLVLCGDLRASLRGLLLVRPDTRAVLDEMVLRDIVSVLLDDLPPRGSRHACRPHRARRGAVRFLRQRRVRRATPRALRLAQQLQVQVLVSPRHDRRTMTLFQAGTLRSHHAAHPRLVTD